MFDNGVYILWQFLKALLYGYNLNCKWITLCYWSKIVVCCYRRDDIVQVGLVCVEGCGVGMTLSRAQWKLLEVCRLNT